MLYEKYKISVDNIIRIVHKDNTLIKPIKESKMELRVVIKNVYGNKMIYPISYNAELLSKLIKKKTFSDNDVEILKELGYTFKVISNGDI